MTFIIPFHLLDGIELFLFLNMFLFKQNRIMFTNKKNDSGKDHKLSLYKILPTKRTYNMNMNVDDQIQIMIR